MKLEGFINPEKAQELKLVIDQLIQQKETLTWNDESGSDIRIFGIEKYKPEFKKIFFNEELINLFREYLNYDELYSFVMANKLSYKSNNLGSGGGWHRDTYMNKQLKFILYLSDVEQKNGPFEYVLGSHHVTSKIIDLPGQVLEKDIRRYNKGNLKGQIFTGKAGDLLIADTSGIHRGTPIVESVRYAATLYSHNNEFSPSVKKELPEGLDLYEKL